MPARRMIAPMGCRPSSLPRFFILICSPSLPSCDGRLLVLLEKIVEGFAEKVLRRQVQVECQSLELLRDARIKIADQGLFADAAWRLGTVGLLPCPLLFPVPALCRALCLRGRRDGRWRAVVSLERGGK